MRDCQITINTRVRSISARILDSMKLQDITAESKITLPYFVDQSFIRSTRDRINLKSKSIVH